MTAATRFDPWSPEFVAHPYPAYDRLRAEEPVSWFEPTGQWLVSRYDDVNALLRADRHRLRPWSADICGMYELNPSRETADIAVRACEEFSDYLAHLARDRARDPQDDLISALAGVAGLTEDELIGTCVLLLNAGH